MGREKTVTQSMRVSVRVRPPPMDVEATTRVAKNTIELSAPEGLHPHKARRDRFTFDNVFDGNMNDVEDPEELVFRQVALPSIQKTVDGYATCIFAYGQTGSGKTHTMVGPAITAPITQATTSTTPLKAIRSEGTREWGIIPRALTTLVAEVGLKESDVDVGPSCRRGIQHTTLRMSLLEIYNEEISCLLRHVTGAHTKSTGGRTRGTERRCQLRESPIEGPYVEGITVVDVTNAEEALNVYYRAVRQRQTAATSQNLHSSRSHLILTLTLSRRKYASEGTTGEFVVSSKSAIHLIDLAGSERVGRNAMKDGTTRLGEGITINQSLLALGNVLECLAQRTTESQPALPPYRDSKLTFLLKEALGGNSLCHMVATVHTIPESYYETLGTLTFADRVKHITNHATVTECVHDKHRIIAELSAELTMLRREKAEAGAIPSGNLPFKGSAVCGDVQANAGEAFLLQVFPLPLTGGHRTVAFGLPSNGGVRHIELHGTATTDASTARHIDDEKTTVIRMWSEATTMPVRIATVRHGDNGIHTIVNQSPKTALASVLVDGETVGDFPMALVVGCLITVRAPEVEYCYRYVSLSTPLHATRLLRATSMERRADVLGSTPRSAARRSAMKNESRNPRAASVESCETHDVKSEVEQMLRGLFPPSTTHPAPSLYDVVTSPDAVAGVVTMENLFLDGDQWVTFSRQPDLFADIDPLQSPPIVAFTMPVKETRGDGGKEKGALVLRSTALGDFVPSSLAQTAAILRAMTLAQSAVTAYVASQSAIANRAVEETLEKVAFRDVTVPTENAAPTDRVLSRALHIRAVKGGGGTYFACCQPFEVIVVRHGGDTAAAATLVDWNLSSLCVRLSETALRALLGAHASLEETSAEGAAKSKEWRMMDAEKNLEVAQLQQRLDAADDENARIATERDEICRDLRSRLQAAVEDLTSLRRAYDISQIAVDQQTKSVSLLHDTIEARDHLIGELRAEIEGLREDANATKELVVSLSITNADWESRACGLQTKLADFEANNTLVVRKDCEAQITTEDPQLAPMREKLQDAYKALDQQRVKALDVQGEVTALNTALLAEQQKHQHTLQRCEELEAELKNREARPVDIVKPKPFRPKATNVEAPLPDGVMQQKISALKKEKAALSADLEAKTKACHRFDAEVTMLRTEIRKLQAGVKAVV